MTYIPPAWPSEVSKSRSSWGGESLDSDEPQRHGGGGEQTQCRVGGERQRFPPLRWLG